MGHFEVASKLKLAELPVGHKISESDFATMSNDGTFVQLKYVEDEEEASIQDYEVKPGIYIIQKTMAGLKLERTSFVTDHILESFVHTKDVTDKIDCFFRNIHKYKEFGIDIPKRGVLLHGPAGTGKTTIINKISKLYSDNKTAMVIWPTDKFEAHVVKDFIKRFKYTGVERMILVAEDLGGTEIDNARFRSDSSLLSLLDNQEKTFTIPILIIATTNFPENFLSNISNRSGRFDDKIRVGYPPSEARTELLKFFSRGDVPEDALALLASKKGEKFPPAHIKEIVIRSAIYEKSMTDVIKEMIKEIEDYEKAFQEKNGKFGLALD